jgi:ABC-type transport system involved in cytochrome c biogenesis permease subunit
MAAMSVMWLRVAAVLYSVGLLHAILMLVRRREHLFRPALAAFSLATVFHFVSIVEEGVINHRCPVDNFYETLSLCAFLVAILFLFVQWRYHMSSLSAFIFPLISVASLVATLGNPVNAGTSPVVLNVWLIVHIVFVLLGIASLVVTAVASLLYLAQERELKAKKPRKFYYRLPALGTLDDLIAKSMNIGFVLVTLAVIAASTWASLEMGTAWIRGPRIAISFITWGAYMAMVCLRTTAGWRGRKGAIMAVTVLCFAAITWAAHARLGALLATP